MGCGSSNGNQDENLIPKITPINEKKEKKEKFISNLNSMKKLCEDLVFREAFQELVGHDHEKFEEVIGTFWDDHKKKLEDEKYTKDTFKDFSQVISAQSFIEQHLELKEWELHDIIKDYTNYIKPTCSDFAESDFNTLTTLLKGYEDKYPNKQKGLIYYIESLRQQNFALGHININLKLNPDYELKVLNVAIFSESIENVLFLKGLAEIIEFNTNLVSVAIQLIENYNNQPIDRKSLKNINIVLEAIKLNKSIKAVAFTLVKGADMIDLGPEVLNKILEIAKLDQLMGIYFLKISLNSDFGKKLGECLEDLKNLVFLGFASSDTNISYLTDIFQGINKNNSLNVVYLHKFTLPEDKMNALKGLASGCKSLKLFKYFKEEGI